MKHIVLRPDQQRLKDGIYSSWNANNKNVIAVLPTGGGKSIIVSDIVLDIRRIGYRQAVIAHRNELVAQMSHHIADRGIMHNIIGSDKTIKRIRNSHYEKYRRSFINASAETTVAGIDTIVARADKLKDWAAQQHYWTIDEAHHVLKANKWGRGVDMFVNARGLGVSASPARPDGQGLGAHNDGVFHDMVIGADMRWLIDNGALSDYEIVCPESDFEIDDSEITATGDFSQQKMKAASKRSQIVGDVVKNYARYALFKRAICFATDIDTANDIAEQFNTAGIPAAAVSSKSTDDWREKSIKDFQNGKIYVLVNVDLFDEGFDVPACDCVIMARPTASLVKYLQMFGRALRVFEGKLYGLIIDHVSNWKRHGLPDKPRHWSLEPAERRGKGEKDPEDIPLIRCIACAKPYMKISPFCPHCSHVPELPEPVSRSIEQVEGDLILLDRERLEQMRKATQMISLESALQQAVYASGGMVNKTRFIESHALKVEEHKRLYEGIALWAGIGRSKGRSDSEIMRRFYNAMGVDIMTALSVENKTEQFRSMADQVERWCASA